MQETYRLRNNATRNANISGFGNAIPVLSTSWQTTTSEHHETSKEIPVNEGYKPCIVYAQSVCLMCPMCNTSVTLTHKSTKWRWAFLFHPSCSKTFSTLIPSLDAILRSCTDFICSAAPSLQQERCRGRSFTLLLQALFLSTESHYIFPVYLLLLAEQYP